MNQQPFFSNTKFDKAISPEELGQILEAILAGKYSWACVLLLRFIGYDPIHYLPYNTYNRLLKQNCNIGNSTKHKSDGISSRKCLGKIHDLGYLEVCDQQIKEVRGGNLDQGKISSSNSNYCSIFPVTWKFENESKDDYFCIHID